jgi:hypothetical protein
VNETSVKLGHVRADAARAALDVAARANLGARLQAKWQLPLSFPGGAAAAAAAQERGYGSAVARFEGALAETCDGLASELAAQESQVSRFDAPRHLVPASSAP